MQNYYKFFNIISIYIAHLRLQKYICIERGEKKNMNFRVLALLIGSLYVIANSLQINSQTFMVRTATINNGSWVYTEVFEYDYVDEKPEFPGGGNSLINFINQNRQYPTEAYELGIQGKVTCSFIVHPDGKLSHIKILRGVERSLNDEALRLVSIMPDWIPGKIHDHTVPVRVICNIPFRK